MDYIAIFKQTYNNLLPDSLETALMAMKIAGASQIDSIRVVMSELKITLREADALILNSKTWENEKELTLKLRNDIADLWNDTEDKV
jgi:hypothetical protein